MKWYSLVFLAITVEALITYIKQLFVRRSFQWQLFASAVVGIGAALFFGLDLFATAGLAARTPFVGQILTGVLISRGSNYIFDLLGRMTRTDETAPSPEVPDFFEPAQQTEE